MSEGIIVALISFASAVVTAAITGFATMEAAKIKNKKKNDNSVSCGIVGLLASIGAAVGLVLGALFAQYLFQGPEAENESVEAVEAETIESGESSEVIESSSVESLSVELPTNLSCQQHSSGYCGLTMSVSWSNIDPDSGYYIYTIGHGLYYQPEMWWVAGNGAPINSSSGTWKITDGAYGNVGDSLGVFACLTKTQYSFDGRKEILLYERPDCERYSQEIYFQPE